MTYEEKLDLIINELVEAKKRTRVGKLTKIFTTKQSELLKKIDIHEIHEILLQLQDDKKLLKIKTIPTALQDVWVAGTDSFEYFLIKIYPLFDSWYEDYLLERKGRLKDMDFLNLLKIYDVVLDIEQQLQISGSPTVFIPSLQLRVRFIHLFPMDSIGTRKTYQTYRGEGIKYLANRKIVSEPKFIDDLSNGYGFIKITVNVSAFDSFKKEIEIEYKKINLPSSKEVKVSMQKETNTEKVRSPKITYDSQKRKLSINGKEVQFKNDSFRVKLLELLLKNENNRKKEWSWDEVIETIEKIECTGDDNTTKEQKNKFYSACDGLSKHIASKTGITDLLLFTKSTVQINSPYV